ncbi:isoprenyl transferase [Kordiimonas aestuarii]|uniref:isoprenyl transferase n=1 Tax=Kordiimonas aestuarii TaxID=1005925 RepID=UPI0021D37A85|nr:isoprenyl transferase [Kordiimonas aestuarii]
MATSAQKCVEETGDACPLSHVAIIMDGNGRWATRHGKARSAGHRKGADAVREAIEGAVDCGINYLTLYAFSSENWNRPADEVSDLMALLKLYLQREIKSLHKQGIRLRVIGRRDRLSADIVSMIDKAEQKTAGNSRMTLVIALSYGSRDELVTAVQSIAEAVASGKMRPEDICEADISQALWTADIPDPDLIIRTSGEQRLSNFLLWQAAYTEFSFPDLLWPDFTKADFRAAVDDFLGRHRRFGARP